MPHGWVKPVISDALTVPPDVVYSPTVPAPTAVTAKLVTNRSVPDTAIAAGPLNPVISEAFTVAPEVLYSPMVPLPGLATNRSVPDTGDTPHAAQPGNQRGVYRRAGGGVFANRPQVFIHDEQIVSRDRDARTIETGN